MDTIENIQKRINMLPHAGMLGMRLAYIENGVAEIHVPYDERFVGDPETGVVHGGVMFALLDTVCGVAIMEHESGPYMAATISLRVDYMRSATPGQTIRARSRCYHITRSVAFLQATAYDDDDLLPVAQAMGSFTLEKRR